MIHTIWCMHFICKPLRWIICDIRYVSEKQGVQNIGQFACERDFSEFRSQTYRTLSTRKCPIRMKVSYKFDFEPFKRNWTARKVSYKFDFVTQKNLFHRPSVLNLGHPCNRFSYLRVKNLILVFLQPPSPALIAYGPILSTEHVSHFKGSFCGAVVVVGSSDGSVEDRWVVGGWVVDDRVVGGSSPASVEDCWVVGGWVVGLSPLSSVSLK